MNPLSVARRCSLLLLAAAALLLGGCAAVEVREVKAPLPQDFPASGFSHAAFESLLHRFVKNDRVDYAAWHADAGAVARLDSYLAAVAAFSPDNAPQRFPSRNDAKAYWLHVYNALVIKGVLDHWPLDSVNDVKAPLEVVRGYGFFYRLGFIVGGRSMNLYDIEHEKVLKQWQDPRAHFVLNCASSSCPVIRPTLPGGADLEPFLAKATQEFVADPGNVHVDHAQKKLRLSQIFEWYQADFINDLQRRAVPAKHGIADYLIDVAPAALKEELRRAATSGYKIEYVDYDWAINKTATAKP